MGAASGRQSRAGWHMSDSNTGIRNIEVHRNWLARLFRVKPATSYMCFNISRLRTRQEIAIVMKDWRKFGMRDVQVNRERNIVFGRVGRNNCESPFLSVPHSRRPRIPRPKATPITSASHHALPSSVIPYVWSISC